MKKRQINKIKVWMFEEKELKEKLLLNDEQIKLVLTYQDKFPELLQKKDGFCIDGRNLHKQLGVTKAYSTWIKKNLAHVIAEKNSDYEVSSPQGNNPKGGRPTLEYNLTVETAKQIAMITGSNSQANKQLKKNSKLVRKYFILMENTLRNYETWNNVREIEKNGYNVMKQYIKEWCERKGFDSTIDIFYSREADAINVALLGYKSKEVNALLHNDDKLTRNHLNIKVNKAIESLQEFNINLLIADMDFETRKELINKTCQSKYKDLKAEFQEIIK